MDQSFTSISSQHLSLEQSQCGRRGFPSNCRHRFSIALPVRMSEESELPIFCLRTSKGVVLAQVKLWVTKVSKSDHIRAKVLHQIFKYVNSTLNNFKFKKICVIEHVAEWNHESMRLSLLGLSQQFSQSFKLG